jgi:metal-sulfur cluster biosynthetic enzyme
MAGVAATESDPADATTRSRPLPVVESKRPRGLPAHVLSHASGGRDLWSDPRPRPSGDLDEALLELLSEVLDPELPISLVDLGLIYGARLAEGVATIDLTYTATACPCMEFIREDIRDRLLREEWIGEVRIREVWDPPWSRDRISREGREQLKTLGVTV